MYKFWVNKEGKPFTGSYYMFKTFKVYNAYKERLNQDQHNKDFNESFTGQFLKAGFEILGVNFIDGTATEPPKGFFLYKKKISPTTNWFGISLMEPDTIFLKGNKEMVMSLNGVESPYNPKFHELFKSKSIRYICMKKDNDIIYEDWTGNLPPKELVDEFIQ